MFNSANVTFRRPKQARPRDRLIKNLKSPLYKTLHSMISKCETLVQFAWHTIKTCRYKVVLILRMIVREICPCGKLFFFRQLNKVCCKSANAGFCAFSTLTCNKTHRELLLRKDFLPLVTRQPNRSSKSFFAIFKF